LTDKWHGLTMEDIRQLEIQAKEELDKVKLNSIKKKFF